MNSPLFCSQSHHTGMGLGLSDSSFQCDLESKGINEVGNIDSQLCDTSNLLQKFLWLEICLSGK